MRALDRSAPERPERDIGYSYHDWNWVTAFGVLTLTVWLYPARWGGDELREAVNRRVTLLAAALFDAAENVTAPIAEWSRNPLGRF